MQKEEVIFIQNQIGGYEFINLNLLEQAFTRKSFTQENGGENNEILEFIGDKVIDIAVVRYLTKMYASHYYNQLSIPEHLRRYQKLEPFHCDKNEGQLTKLKQRLVEKKTLALRIDDLRLAQFLRMGEGDKKNNVDENPSVKEDLFEAIVGAVAIDCDYDYSKTQEVVETMLSPDMFLEDSEEADYVGKIYEWDATTNRMSPAGISYLYLASDIYTTLSECRVGEHEKAVTAQFVAKKDIQIIDFSHNRYFAVDSIFNPEYDHDERWINGFWRSFVNEISLPVSPDKKDHSYEYAATQLVAEFFRSKGYEGICFNSSVGKGKNYVFFYGPNPEITRNAYPYPFNAQYFEMVPILEEYTEIFDITELVKVEKMNVSFKVLERCSVV